MATATAERKAIGGSKGHFVNLTAGKLMGLRQITDEGRRFKVLALDQSNSFRKALRAMHEKEGSPAEPSHEEILATKLEMVRVLAPHASATLLDVNFGARQSVASFSLPWKPSIVPISSPSTRSRDLNFLTWAR